MTLTETIYTDIREWIDFTVRLESPQMNRTMWLTELLGRFVKRGHAEDEIKEAVRSLIREKQVTIGRSEHRTDLCSNGLYYENGKPYIDYELTLPDDMILAMESQRDKRKRSNGQRKISK